MRRRRIVLVGAGVLVVIAAAYAGLRATGRFGSGPADLLNRELLNAYTPAEPDVPLDGIIADRGLSSNTGLSLVIDKSDMSLQVRAGQRTLKTYPVALGSRSLDDKQHRGDRLTPEGEFYICQRNLKPRGMGWDSVWMRLSYPNAEDARRGLQSGLVTEQQARAIERACAVGGTPDQNTDLGSGVGIHAGGIAPRTWTQGSIALQRVHAEEVYQFTRLGTRVTIRK